MLDSNYWLAFISFSVVFLVLIGFFSICSVTDKHRAYKQIVTSDFEQTIKSKGYFPTFFGQCMSVSVTGETYRVNCASLLTETQLRDFRESSLTKSY